MEETESGQFLFVNCETITVKEESPQDPGYDGSSSTLGWNPILPLEVVTIKQEFPESSDSKDDTFIEDSLQCSSSSLFEPDSINPLDFVAVKQEITEPQEEDTTQAEEDSTSDAETKGGDPLKTFPAEVQTLQTVGSMKNHALNPLLSALHRPKNVVNAEMSDVMSVTLSPGDQKHLNSGKKRTLNISKWVDKKRKTSRDAGNPYITKKKKPVPGKLPPTEGRVCSCQFKCGDIEHEQALRQFKNFYMLDYNHQTSFLVNSCMKIMDISRRRDEDSFNNSRTNSSMTESDFQILQPLKREPKGEKTRKLENHKCEICNKSFVYHARLVKHQQSVHCEMKTFICEMCNKSFARKGDLVYHIAYKHSKSTPFSCETCGKSFKAKTDLVRHQNNTHNRLKPYTCETCEKSFGSKYELTRHRNRVHLRLEPYSCEICQKSFAVKNQLIVHQNNVHLRLKPYTCGSCHKSFQSKHHLNRHQSSVHKKLKPFSCETCNKVFGQKDKLIVHVAHIHSGLKPYTCEMCNNPYSRKNSLIKHIKNVHSSVS